MENKAIFFDRDDTLIIDKNYMFKTTDLEYFPDTISTLKKLQELGFHLFIVTNQSGVGRGFFTLEQMHEFNNHMLKDLKAHGVEIKELVFCPHAPNDLCECRKPKAKLINDLCDKYKIDKKLSYMVGDKQSDIQAGSNANINAIGLNIKSDLEIKKLSDLISILT